MRRALCPLIPALGILTGFATCACSYGQQAKQDGRGPGVPPISGNDTRGVRLLDKVMLDHMNKIGCTSATLAISFRGRLVHSRGYGWVDKDKKIPTEPTTLIGIASCEKPITAAAIRQLARSGKLNLDDGVFQVLGIKPRGDVIDSRVHKISLRNLLDHKAGWQGEPIDRAKKAARESGEPQPLAVDVVLSFLMTQRLSSDPGTKHEYCNFCFDTLRFVIEQKTKKPAVDYFRKELFKPFGKDEVKGFASPTASRKAGEASIVWNDREGGPVSASAPALCKFMQHFWLTGEPRDRSNQTWAMYGSLPSSTTLMLWRPDGINVAAVFNGRGDDTHDKIRQDLDTVIGGLK
jgi:CubicO group peptidase (beta-lactamase class C family)